MKESNILLAQFIGWEEQTDPTKRWFGHWFTTEGRRQSDLFFDFDWNDLILVVDKIESLGYYTNSDMDFTGSNNQIVMHFFRIYKGGYQGVNIAFGKHHNKIEAVYNACVEFIEWWNKENK